MISRYKFWERNQLAKGGKTLTNGEIDLRKGLVELPKAILL